MLGRGRARVQIGTGIGERRWIKGRKRKRTGRIGEGPEIGGRWRRGWKLGRDGQGKRN